MLPAYDLKKIKFTVDPPTFERATALYESGKVTEISESGGYCYAVVFGTKRYDVSVSLKDFKRGDCTCYLGQRDVLCKHIVAVSLYIVMNGHPLKEEDKQFSVGVRCSGRLAGMSKEELSGVQKSISAAMRCIKPYSGPSSTWFRNQDSLSEGCRMLSAIVSDLPINQETAKILVKLLLRLDKKLCMGGVDDSNGIVSGLMYDVVNLLQEYVRMDDKCMEVFKGLLGKDTCFNWENPLVRMFEAWHKG
ncbi:MAG: SWIM zinc finger family protein [Candidatus Omnitrophica bacterium]|nr:SWIM zinc finger family protein [Candidatus Omnitrophota bacterium]